ncbi:MULTISPECIES: restriction endonuclease subunit S [Vibrio]|uniref:restriction endonuclease subunit S n=1 Tax=Vibrio TaxID=662 RepID=UPI00128EB635|nr:restriction endonuclease subunit S [Vibrio parahaemolyticus]MBE4250552.1 restriction endonuclease subunit S [Vibrio parahaemolyticus]MBE4259041.1 restriction endonuclease subunit S [Vibrio parahaemolyticus]MCL1707467.1 restriction endonuclease subunit S [Vibrio parahaemolyticus]MCL1712083.1 restriction endonuclease subunit S [Vibrio parahaemolyticus]MCL1716591.1 restriction endonuclease subunit S [Vibrio parahaemolyticus]
MARSLAKDGIPSGWKYDLLDKFATRCSGHTPSKSFPEYWDGGIKWISLADSFRLDKGYVYETDKEISEAGIANSSAELHPAETVVLSRDAGIGKSGVMAVPMAVSQHFIAWKCDNTKKLNSWFLYNWLQLNKAEFERQAVGSTIKTIGLPYFKKLKIAVPPYIEQKKIAKILSTWDKAITTTEELLNNSQQQKKALMQQLLTGKKRLLDKNGVRFSGEWKATAVAAFIKESRVPGSTGDIAKKITVKLYGNGVVAKDEKRSGSESTKYYRRSAGQFIYSKLDFLNGAFGIIPEELDGYESTLDLPAFDFLGNVNVEWFTYYVSREEFYSSNLGLANGGRKARRVNPNDLLRIKIPTPSLEEQQKIAAVLSTADQEITALQHKLEALKQEKKALMQQLLTGKRRVLVS